MISYAADLVIRFIYPDKELRGRKITSTENMKILSASGSPTSTPGPSLRQPISARGKHEYIIEKVRRRSGRGRSQLKNIDRGTPKGIKLQYHGITGCTTLGNLKK